MSNRRVSVAPFVHDQRAAAAADFVARWRTGQPEEVAARDLADLPAVKLVVAALTVLAGRAQVEACAHVGSPAHLGPVVASLRFGLMCDGCQAGAESMAPPVFCSACGDRLSTAGDGRVWPVLVDVGGMLVHADLCSECWAVDP